MQNFDINEVLDAIKKRHDLKSDYKLGVYLGITNGSIRNFRHGRSLPDERICGLLAKAADIDPLVLAANVQAQRSKTEEARSMWAMIAERLQTLSPGVAAALLSVAAASSFVADDAYAASVSDRTDFAQVSPNNLYIVYLLSLVLQQLLRTFRDLKSDSQLCLQP